MIGIVTGSGLANVALRYSGYTMEETQDAAPSSTEPMQTDVAQQAGEQGNVSAAPAESADAGSIGSASTTNAGQDGSSPAAVTGDLPNAVAGTPPAESATPATAEPSASQSSAEVTPVGEPDAPAAPNALGLGESDTAGSASDAGTAGAPAADSGEPLAEEQKDSGTPSPSSSTAGAAQGDNPGNMDGQADSAATAISPEAALAGIVETTAAAFSVELEQRFETRHYPDGSTIKTVGALPDESPVSYPSPAEPAVDTPHGLLNAIEHYLTTALRSSRTDGHKLIAQLRSIL